MSTWICPRCGAPLVLREWGSYHGYRQIAPDGSIVPDSYMDEGSELQDTWVACASHCGYENHRMEADESGERVIGGPP